MDSERTIASLRAEMDEAIAAAASGNEEAIAAATSAVRAELGSTIAAANSRIEELMGVIEAKTAAQSQEASTLNSSIERLRLENHRLGAQVAEATKHGDPSSMQAEILALRQAQQAATQSQAKAEALDEAGRSSL